MPKREVIDMEIHAEITGIQYEPFLGKKLEVKTFNNFDINESKGSCLLQYQQSCFVLSKWVSPKRTRSYPYARVYDTLCCAAKRVTVIPVIKDEGQDGDRDFLQWDTIALMSLLDVFTILAYYKDASLSEKEKGKHKITDQKFDNCYVLKKIKELAMYHSSALHWNLKELDKLESVVQLSQTHYQAIAKRLNIRLHNDQGIERFLKQIRRGLDNFRNYSREKASQAQSREYQTLQPKESLLSSSKCQLTITNYLGGKYFFTTDEVKWSIKEGKLWLIESKHTTTSIIPSENDIKDGLIKMILYTNLKDVKVKGIHVIKEVVPVLQLTSPFIKKELTSQACPREVEDFIKLHRLSKNKKALIKKLFHEAQTNNFSVYLKKA